MTANRSDLRQFYRELGELNADHGVSIVQNRQTKKIYIKKELSVYNRGVFSYLQQHPVANMPQVLELDEENGTLLVIEEYMTGDTLQELLEVQGCFTEEQTADYAIQLCRILSQLHGAEPAIIHRDIKPSNVMLSPDGVVKLIDLDAAKQYSGEKSQDTVLLGTTGYAAPEQYGAGSSSVQTDLYSVGVLMNVLLCGELPAVQMAQGKLQPIIRKCLQTHPQDRYGSAEELGRAIAAVCPVRGQETTILVGWKRFLPPGFRSVEPAALLLSALGYGALFWVGLTMELENTESVVELWINRVLITVMLLMIVLFTGNYLNIQKQFPFARSENRIVRWIGVAVVDVLIFCLCPMVIGILEGLFFQK